MKPATMLALSAAAVGLWALSGSQQTQPPPLPPPPKPKPTGGGTAPATGTGATTADLVISVYAIRPATWSAAWAGSTSVPRLVEWSGEQQPGSVHPTWQHLGDRLRDGSGRLLPALLRQWGAEGARRIAVVGFSAGSNSGLRQLLWNAEDRARIDACFSIDGIHPTVNAAGEVLDPRQLEGLRAFCSAAAAKQRLAVVTASNVAAPSGAGKTAEELRDLAAFIASARGVQQPAPPLAWLGTSPPRDGSLVTQAQALGLIDAAELGDFSAWWFSGNDAGAHIRQANQVLPLLMRGLLRPRWQGGIAV
jgi:hypothetical protein